MQIELQQIHKRFGKVHALKGINLKVESGTIHGLVGENGAGKSTLMKILTGYLSKSEGRVILNGEVVEYDNPEAAARLGIGMLYQEPQDFPPLTVLENFMVGRDTHPDNNRERQRRRLNDLSERVHFHMEPSAKLEKRTVGERQQLEFLRLLGRDVQLLILDEPTTGISDQQKERLFKALHQIRDEGHTILLVSHKLEEVETLCDRVTILRQGVVVGEESAPFHISRLLELMFDKPPESVAPREASPTGEPLLQFNQVSANGERTGLVNCTVTAHKSEIIGLAGLSGSGQGVFLRLAAALRQPIEGDIHYQNQNLTHLSHKALKKQGVAFLPTDRLKEGLISGFTIRDHFALANQLSGRQAQKDAEWAINHFRIQGAPETPAEALSGGNQQRLQLALIPATARLILLENPTRGLDVESGLWIWKHLRESYANDGIIIFSSAELDEILAVADRVLVFFDGAIVSDFSQDEMNYQVIAAAMTGQQAIDNLDE